MKLIIDRSANSILAEPADQVTQMFRLAWPVYWWHRLLMFITSRVRVNLIWFIWL
jgi:hypothetical protein